MSIPLSKVQTPFKETSPDPGAESRRQHYEPTVRPARPVPIRKATLFLGALVLLSACYWTYHAALPTTPAGAGDQQMRAVAVSRTVSKKLKLTGVLAPREQHTVTAPFSGLVLEEHVRLGQRVGAGEVLARLHAGAVEIQLREAESALIKAQQRVRELEDWKNSQEASKARRDVERSQRRLETLRQRLAQSKKLLDIGIIPESEYESEVERLRDQEMDVASAWEALDSTLQKGDATEREIAALELKNAESKVSRLRATLAEAVIQAPIEGIIVAAKTAGEGSGRGGGDLDLNIGDHVKEGQALFSIADTEELIVRSRINEIDINELELGHEATVVTNSLPGVTMIGRLTKIGYQARTDTMRSNPFPSFDIELTLDEVPAAQLRRLRLGVTVQLAMETYHKDSAIIVPFEAVDGGAAGPFVRVVADDDALERRPVRLGASLVEGVEVISGLQDGDVVAIHRPLREDES